MRPKIHSYNFLLKIQKATSSTLHIYLGLLFMNPCGWSSFSSLSASSISSWASSKGSLKASHKIDFTIKKQLPLWFMKYSNYLSNLLPFYSTQIINSFLNLRISANYNKVERPSANGYIHIKWIVSLLQNLFSSY